MCAAASRRPARFVVDADTHPQTLAVLAEKVAARRTGRSSADLYARAGDLWMEQLRQQHKAKAAWAKALGVVPGHPWAARSRAVRPWP